MASKKTAWKFYCINIKIQSDPKPHPSDYSKLMLTIFKDDVYFNYASDKAIAIRNQFSGVYQYKGKEYQYLYGKLIRFTLLEGGHWYSRGKRDYMDVEIPENTYPNPVEADYIFIPSIHRFLLKKGKLSVKNVELFIQKSFELVANKGQSIKTSIETSEDVLEKIISSRSLLSLDVELTYTNDDIGDEAKELMDDLLKQGNIGQFNANIRPDATQELDTNSKFIRGVIELAKDNGNLKASIINNNGKKEKIVTEAHPEITTISAESPDTILDETVSFFLKKHPRRND